MVLTWTEMISHTCSLSRKTNTALTLFQLNSRTTTVWNRQRSWLILRASWIRYTKSRRPFLSKNLNLFKFNTDTCLRKQMQDVKTTFIRKVKRGPVSSTKLYSYLFFTSSMLWYIGNWQHQKIFLIEFLWNDYPNEYNFSFNENL